MLTITVRIIARYGPQGSLIATLNTPSIWPAHFTSEASFSRALRSRGNQFAELE